MGSTTPSIVIIGGGLAGSEAALQLAKQGLAVTLYDMKPETCSPAHHSKTLAEIVCSNSFGSLGEGTASGLLKLEMGVLGCELLKIAESVAVPAGKALAVDRDKFTEAVTERIKSEPLVTLLCADVTEIPTADAVLIATGPMTSPGLTQAVQTLLEREQLYFFDAASPIVTRESVDMNIAFFQDRYDKSSFADADGEGSKDSYINCPFDKAQYDALIEKILTAEKTPLKDFEKESAKFFESCLPVEEIASRGPETLRFGPMKPVGLTNPHTGSQPHAVVQLRQDNAEGTLYNLVGFQTNLKWGAQKEMLQMIPGLENADVVRFGVMHRNTYIHSPEVLTPTLQLKKHPQVFFAGQLTGTEGYTESIATGMYAALNIAKLVRGERITALPKETMLGSLLAYITREEAIGKSFQPINSNWGILPELPIDPTLSPKEAKAIRKNKKARNETHAHRALGAMANWRDAELAALT